MASRIAQGSNEHRVQARPAGGRCNELQSRLPCRSSSSECWQAGAQVERGSTSVAKRLPRADRGRRDGSYSCRGRYRSCRRRWMVRICVTWDVLLVLLNPPQDSTSCRAGARPGHPITGREQMQQRVVLFNYFVGTGEQCWRDVETERLGGLEVDGELELCRLLHRKVGGTGAPKNLVDVPGGAALQVRDACSIGHEAAGGDEVQRPVQRRQAQRDGAVGDELALPGRQRVTDGEQRVRSLSLSHLERGIEVVRSTHFE